MQSVQFDETSHSISDGQPYEGVFTLGYYLDVRAGRHETAEVAQYFNAGITPDNALGLLTSKSDPPLPSELNFAISGNLSVAMDINTTGVCTEMKIAQGHRPTVNNWWIAGTKCHHNSAGLECPCGNYNVTFSGTVGTGRYKIVYADKFYVQFAWKVKTSNLVACSWQPTTCLLSARKIQVTWIFHLLEARLCPSVSRPESLLEGDHNQPHDHIISYHCMADRIIFNFISFHFISYPFHVMSYSLMLIHIISFHFIYSLFSYHITLGHFI